MRYNGFTTQKVYFSRLTRVCYRRAHFRHQKPKPARETSLKNGHAMSISRIRIWNSATALCFTVNPKKNSTLPKQKARGLGCGNDRIRLDNGGLPHAGQEVVRNVLVENVHPVPDAAVLGVLLPQLVQDVRGVEAGVVAQLSSDHLQTGWSWLIDINLN